MFWLHRALAVLFQGEHLRSLATCTPFLVASLFHPLRRAPYSFQSVTGDLKAGVEFWIKALKFDPTLPDARQNVIKSLMDQGRHADALRHARKARKLRPDSADARVQIGDACRGLRDYPCAKAAYNAAIALDPAHFSAHFALAAAHRDLMEDLPVRTRGRIPGPDNALRRRDLGALSFHFSLPNTRRAPSPSLPLACMH